MGFVKIFRKNNVQDAYLFRPKPNLEGFVWSHKSITGVISQRQFPHNANFWQVGVLDVVLSEYLDKSHNFTNLIFCDVTL